MKKFIKQAFTLIELLVVIAIIGILSGLIVVSMSGVTQKATIAKAQVFSNSLRNSLMLNLISEWKFDGNGLNDGDNATTAYTLNTWSGGNCSISGTPKIKTGSSCVSGSCLQFNGANSDQLNCGTGTSIGFSSFTYALWAKTSVTSAQLAVWRDSSVVGWGGRFYIPRNPTQNSGFELTYSGYSAGNIYMFMAPLANISNTIDGNWHFFVGTCDRSQHKAPDVYLDGKLNNGSGGGYCDQIVDNIVAGNLYIGGTTNYYFTGLIDDVRIYNAAMPTSQVKEQYFAGLNNLLANGGITSEEYQNRIGELAIK